MSGPPDHDRMVQAGSWRRVTALIRKEAWQVLRDPSAIAVGVVLPILLLVLFGYALSFDIRHLPVAVIVDHSSADSDGVTAAMRLSPYFSLHRADTMAQAERMMAGGEVSAIVRFPQHFARDVAGGDAGIQVTANATDVNIARVGLSYVQGAIAVWAATAADRSGVAATGPSVSVDSRMWFNEANDSAWFLVPGLIVMVITLIGALLTSSVIAREWERGTFEALFATPARPLEILVGKTVPYFLMGMVGLALSVIGARLLFGVPLRGSVWVLVLVSALYLLVALGMGLLISAATKSQFVANQITTLVTFLPAMMLSGFLFDIRSMPWVIAQVTRIFPARYFVAVLQTLFLAGDVWAVIWPNAAILAGMALVLMMLAVRTTRKTLG